jgi:predicted Fe-Mo cluster-binding NifX family protein
MKIMVTAKGQNLDCLVDPRLGRCGTFILVDGSTLEFRAIDNQAGRDAPQGAGVRAAQQVAGSGATVLLTGHCGPKAHRLLTAAGVSVFVNVDGTVREAVDRFKEGRLLRSDGPDVESHWS